MTCNTYDAGATKASPNALTVDQLRSQLYSFEDIISITNDPSRKYDVTKLSSAISLTLTQFNLLANKDDYPNIVERINQGPITNSEYADFIDSSGYNIDQIISIFSGVSVTTFSLPDYYTQLDYYYNKNFAASLSGGFCSRFANVLGAIALVSAGASLISQLSNGISALIGQLNSIKDILFNLVDKLKDIMLKKIEQLVSKITEFKTQVASTIKYLSNKAMKVKEFFSDLSIESIKAKIEDIIAKMGGAFEELTPEVIAYLLFKLCQFVETVQNFMQSPVDAFKGIIDNFILQELNLTNISNMARIGSVNAGGYRMDPFEIARIKEQLANEHNQHAEPGVYPKGYITRPFTRDEWTEYSSLTTAGNRYVQFGPQVINQNDPIVGAGVKMLKPEILMILFRIAKRMGTSFTVNSGYRSPTYNASIGGAKNSMHKTGCAIDVSMSGRNDEFRNRFIEFASQEGVGGIGTYSSFIHIDTGARRTWNSLNGRALAIHAADGFRKGAPVTETENITSRDPTI
jgi:hypothetical protein